MNPQLQKRAHTRMHNLNRLKLGIFAPNCSGGLASTTVPERWNASWDANVELIKLAEDAGLEFMLPLARWTGYGGPSDYQGTSLDTLSWAAGLLALSKEIVVFATVHTAFIHPLVAAKQLATIDQIGRGRMGLNIVCGWNKPEYDMFGLQMPDDRAVRYAFGQEWYDVVHRIWCEHEAFDHDGTYFKLRGVKVSPRPFGDSLPTVLNAGSSGVGYDFAARNADYLFTVVVDFDKTREEVQKLTALARKLGREVDLFTTSYVVCRPTRKEAEEYHDYYANKHADWPSAERLMMLQGLTDSKSFPPEMMTRFRTRFAAGHGTYPLVGAPDDIADELERMSQAGLAGTTISFVDYNRELPYFVQEVMPRLERKGLRLAVTKANS